MGLAFVPLQARIAGLLKVLSAGALNSIDIVRRRLEFDPTGEESGLQRPVRESDLYGRNDAICLARIPAELRPRLLLS